MFLLKIYESFIFLHDFVWFDSKAENTSLTVVMIFYAILATIGAFLGLYLPETKDREIPDTIEEAENLHNFEIKNCGLTIVASGIGFKKGRITLTNRQY